MDHFFGEDLLFEVPVYRISYDEFHKELKDTILETARNMEGSDSWGQLPHAEIREEAERWALRRYGRPYWYNEMIGVIRIYQDGGSIKGQFWGQPQKSFRRNFRHYNYRDRGRVIEIHEPPGDLTSMDVYEELRDDLRGLTRKGGTLERRHVDLSTFERLGPYIDWLKVLGWRQGT